MVLSKWNRILLNLNILAESLNLFPLNLFEVIYLLLWLPLSWNSSLFIFYPPFFRWQKCILWHEQFEINNNIFGYESQSSLVLRRNIRIFLELDENWSSRVDFIWSKTLLTFFLSRMTPAVVRCKGAWPPQGCPSNQDKRPSFYPISFALLDAPLLPPPSLPAHF